jgi:hypothetical protein
MLDLVIRASHHAQLQNLEQLLYLVLGWFPSVYML